MSSRTYEIAPNNKNVCFETLNLPMLVHLLKHGALFWDLIANVLRPKDRLQVKPRRLNFQPGVNDRLDTPLKNRNIHHSLCYETP